MIKHELRIKQFECQTWECRQAQTPSDGNTPSWNGHLEMVFEGFFLKERRSRPQGCVAGTAEEEDAVK